MPIDPSKPPDTVYISFSTDITPSSAEMLLKTCCELATKGVKTLYLLISTPGGNVINGINLYNLLRALPCKIVTHNVASINSIGNVLFLAGDDRYANPGATFMFHGVGINAPPNMRFEEKNLLEWLDTIQADQRQIGSIISSRTDFSSEEIEKLFLQAATKDAEFAKDKGIINEIREAKIPSGAPVVQLIFQR